MIPTQDQDSQSKNLQKSITALAKTQRLGPLKSIFAFATIVDTEIAQQSDMPDMDTFSVRVVHLGLGREVVEML